MRILGYVLIVAGGIAFFVSLGANIPGLLAGEIAFGAAVGKIALMGVLPLLVLGAVGALLIVSGRKRASENEQLEYEQMILHRLHRDGRLNIGELLSELPLDMEQLREVIISMGNKHLFTGYANWRGGEIIANEDIELSDGECPVCSSLTASTDPRVAVCTRCDAYIFLPAKVSGAQ